MGDVTWRSDSEFPEYQWAVTRWELLHRIGGESVDVAEEWGVDMGTPEKLRKAIRGVEIDDEELLGGLLSDLDKLEREDQ